MVFVYLLYLVPKYQAQYLRAHRVLLGDLRALKILVV